MENGEGLVSPVALCPVGPLDGTARPGQMSGCFLHCPAPAARHKAKAQSFWQSSVSMEKEIMKQELRGKSAKNA